MRYILSIRGTNGSGKSTIPMSMMDDPNMHIIIKPYQGKPTKIATVFPTYDWVALGPYYFDKNGGADCLRDKIIIQKAFWYMLKNYPEYSLILEGMIPSHTFSTYFELFTAAEKKYPDLQTVILELTTPVETCLERIQHRNDGKPINENNIISNYKSARSSCKKFEDSGVTVLRWNTIQNLPVEFKKYPKIYKLIHHSEKVRERRMLK